MTPGLIGGFLIADTGAGSWSRGPPARAISVTSRFKDFHAHRSSGMPGGEGILNNVYLAPAGITVVLPSADTGAVRRPRSIESELHDLIARCLSERRAAENATVPVIAPHSVWRFAAGSLSPDSNAQPLPGQPNGILSDERRAAFMIDRQIAITHVPRSVRAVSSLAPTAAYLPRSLLRTSIGCDIAHDRAEVRAPRDRFSARRQPSSRLIRRQSIDCDALRASRIRRRRVCWGLMASLARRRLRLTTAGVGGIVFTRRKTGAG